MRKVTSFLLVVLLLLPAALAMAQGQDKVIVCHLDDDGNLMPISIADPALDSHLAHGDAEVGVDVDENCEPLVAQAGCFPYSILHEGDLYVLTDGSILQFVGGTRPYTDSTCTTQHSDLSFTPTAYLVWATSLDEAKAICPKEAHYQSLTANLYGCFDLPNS